MTPSQIRPPRKLRRRLTWALVALCGALGLSYLVVLPQLLFYAEDRVFDRLVQAAWDRLDASRSDDRPAQAAAAGMQLWSPARPAPPHLRARLAGASVGVEEWLDVPGEGAGSVTDLFVRTGLLDGVRHHLVFDVGTLESFDEQQADAPFLIAIGVGSGLCVLGLVIGTLLIRGVSRSLRTLHQVGDTQTSSQAAPLLEKLGEDEIGAIARGFDRARSGLARALEREQRFTRDASHELRTPVTVIRGATELLCGELERGTDSRPARMRELLERVEGSVTQIEELIVAFLWLARSERGDPDQGVESLSDAVREVVAELRETEGAGLGAMDLDCTGDLRIRAPGRVVRVVIRNLVSNALRHGDPGSLVRVFVSAQGFSVDNRIGDPSPPRTQEPYSAASSQGLGLSIVDDLCARFGWSLSIQAESGRFVAVVAPDPASEPSPG